MTPSEKTPESNVSKEYPAWVWILAGVYGLGTAFTSAYLLWTTLAVCGFGFLWNELRAMVWPIYWLVRLLG